ncbi:transglutaminase domain-containing protein [Formosa haliotis]|uniref:transglutaminase domain-containing protein n=1 Tax=Formosa haliotis TaxID=1555194 RepID=UPI0008258A96|nr:transglutaminase domain-containing protein [Formosa haliotis]
MIENIDLAFEAHNKLPNYLQSDFSDFLNYVVPYRCSNEPLEFTKRRELYEKYLWVYDSLKSMTIEKVIEKIYNDLNLEGGQKVLTKFEGALSLTQVEKLKFGRCDDLVNYFVALLRSLGLAAGKDYTNHWGNFHHSSGHSWVFLKTKNELLPIQVSVDEYSNSVSKEIFNVGSFPKIYRFNFVKLKEDKIELLPLQDVTSEYRLTSDIEVQDILKQGKNENYKLCVYDNKNEWAVVDENYEYDNGMIRFKNLGRGVLYAICIELNNSLKPINFPFYLDFKGRVIEMSNIEIIDKDAIITRKYPPFFPHINKKKSRISSLNHCIIQGANTLGKNSFDTIFKIEKFNSTQKIIFKFNTTKSYNYYRLHGVDSIKIHLAEFKLCDERGESVTGIEIEKNSLGSKGRLKRLMDDDPLTYIDFRNLDLIFKIPTDKRVRGFKIQARNDDNHINVGELYELMNYDQEWKTIFVKKAKDTFLTYTGFKKNGLYLLRNRTKGYEENVFTFNNDGTQFWFGVSDIGELNLQ